MKRIVAIQIFRDTPPADVVRAFLWAQQEGVPVTCPNEWNPQLGGAAMPEYKKIKQ